MSPPAESSKRPVIAITGASKGLGAALAVAYAEEPCSLYLCARDRPGLDGVAAACEQRNADTHTTRVDVTDPEQLDHWAATVGQQGPPDLIIANAGVFFGHAKDRMETPDEIKTQVETNLLAAINTVNSFLPDLIQRRRGHVVLVSSLAAVFPLADAPAYSASKAGLLAYARAMREYLAEYNIRVSVVLPGHIRSAQTDKHRGDLSGIMSPQQAAGIIRKQLDKGRFLIAFPATTYALIRLSAVLPWWVIAWLNRSKRFYVEQRES